MPTFNKIENLDSDPLTNKKTRKQSSKNAKGFHFLRKRQSVWIKKWQLAEEIDRKDVNLPAYGAGSNMHTKNGVIKSKPVEYICNNQVRNGCKGYGPNRDFISSLSALPLLKSLDLSENSRLFGTSFPAEELAYLTNLEELDLSGNYLNDTPSIQDCTRLSRLKKLKSITLEDNNFNKSIIS